MKFNKDYFLRVLMILGVFVVCGVVLTGFIALLTWNPWVAIGLALVVSAFFLALEE